MASPFAAFRKYQGILLAVFGVIIILVFAIGDPLMQMSHERHVDDPVVVEYKDGKLTHSQLDRKIYDRRAAANLMLRLRQEAVFSILGDAMRNQMPMTEGIILGNNDLAPDATVRSLLMARKATELGMKVSQQEVWDYLIKTVGFEKIREPDIKQLIKGTKEEPTGHTISGMLETIGQQMLANQLHEFIIGQPLFGRWQALMVVPPADQFEYYMKVNRKLKADVVAIPVDDFLGKVAEPTDAELKAYFDLYKDKLPHKDYVGLTELSAASPGFKLPHRAKVQYLKANLDDYADAERSKVTDAEIAEYYEKNKEFDEELRELPLPLTDAEKNKEKDKPKQDDAKKDAAKKDAVKSDGPAAQGTSPPPAKEEPPKATPPSASKTPTASPESNQLAANEVDGKAGDKPATTPVAQVSGAPPATQPASQPSGVNTQPVAQGTGSSPGFPPTTKAEPSKPKPLSEVKDYIHKRLAEQKAEAAIDKMFKEIEGSLRKSNSFRLSVPEGKRRPPVRDLAEFTKDHKLTVHTTGLLTAEQMDEETDIGQSFDSAGQNYPYLIYSNKGPHSLHQVLTTSDGTKGGRYLSWKIEDKDEEIPPLEGDVRQDVIRHWKRGAGLDDTAGKARDLALAEANKLAEQIRKGLSMSDAAKSIGAKLIVTNSFSWLTDGDLPRMQQQPTGPAKLSKIDDIVDPGEAFMEKAFGLQPGEVGVALNHPGTYVYVMKVHSPDLSTPVMVGNFVERIERRQVHRQDGLMATNLEIRKLNQRLFEQLDKDYQLKWVKPVAELTRRDED